MVGETVGRRGGAGGFEELKDDDCLSPSSTLTVEMQQGVPNTETRRGEIGVGLEPAEISVRRLHFRFKISSPVEIGNELRHERVL